MIVWLQSVSFVDLAGQRIKVKKLTQVEIIEVEEGVIGCDGGGQPLGHPMVYLKVVSKKELPLEPVTCPYCSRQFVVKTNSTSKINL